MDLWFSVVDSFITAACLEKVEPAPAQRLRLLPLRLPVERLRLLLPLRPPTHLPAPIQHLPQPQPAPAPAPPQRLRLRLPLRPSVRRLPLHPLVLPIRPIQRLPLRFLLPQGVRLPLRLLLPHNRPVPESAHAPAPAPVPEQAPGQVIAPAPEPAPVPALAAPTPAPAPDPVAVPEPRVLTVEEGRNEGQPDVPEVAVARPPRTCAVCIGDLATQIFIPCGHRCVCSTCADALRTYNRAGKCPYCNGPAIGIFPVFDM